MRLSTPWLACLAEGSLLGLAALLAWWWNYPLLRSFHWTWIDAGIGILGAIPLFGVYRWMACSNWEPLRQLRTFFNTWIIRLFEPWPLWQLVLVSLLAGLGEEILFRDLLQGAFSRQIGIEFSLLLASILFGLAHAITLSYAILATLMGLWLGLLYNLTGNLLVPITAHAFYDAALLIYLTRFRSAPELSNG